MPNRIIKESICTSTQIAALHKDEEIFFYRLLVNCDDYGLLDARPAILRAKCFPLLIDKVKDNDIQKWLLSLANQKLVILYEVGGQPYLKMTTWEKHQQVRAKRSKYPSVEEGNLLISNDINCNQEISNVPVIQSNPIQSESESNPNPIPDKVPYQEILDLYNQTCKSLARAKTLSDARKKAISARWKKNPSIDTFKDLFQKAHSSDFLTGNNKNNWRATFDWLMTDTYFARTLEGNYNQEKGGQPSGATGESSEIDYDKFYQ